MAAILTQKKQDKKPKDRKPRDKKPQSIQNSTSHLGDGLVQVGDGLVQELLATSTKIKAERTRPETASPLRKTSSPFILATKPVLIALSLEPTSEQANTLTEEIARYNSARQFVSDMAYTYREGRKIVLTSWIQDIIVDRFGLTPRFALDLISNVSRKYRRDRQQHLLFRRTDPILLSRHAHSFKYAKAVQSVSLAVSNTRVNIRCFKDVGERFHTLDATDQFSILDIPLGSANLFYDTDSQMFWLLVSHLAGSGSPRQRLPKCRLRD